MDFHKIKLKNSCVKNFPEYRIEISDENRNRYWKTFFYSLSNVCEYQFKAKGGESQGKTIVGK